MKDERAMEPDRTESVDGSQPDGLVETITRERSVDTPTLSYRERDVERREYSGTRNNYVTLYGTDKPYKTRLRIQVSGSYLMYATPTGLLSGFLESPQDGILTMENFTVLQQSGPSERANYLFCCRISMQRDGRLFYLCYPPHADSGAKVQFQPFRADSITEETLDERCFVKHTNGNDLLLQSFTNKDLFLFYDTRRRGLVMRRMKRMDRAPRAFRFSEVPVPDTPTRSRMSAPRKLVSGILRHTPCLRPQNVSFDSDSEPDTDSDSNSEPGSNLTRVE